MTAFPLEALVARLRDDGIVRPRLRMLASRSGRAVCQASTRTLKVVVRLSADLPRLRSELAATTAARSVNLGPDPSPIQEVTEGWHYFVEQHFGDRIWRPWLEPTNHALVADFAERLSCFHSLQSEDERLRMIQPTLARVRTWVQNGESFGLRPPRSLMSALERLEASEIEPKLGLIHGDLRAKNIVLHEGRLKLVDFEHAGRGDTLFDLAKLSLSRGVGDSLFRDFLQHAYDKTDVQLLEVVAHYQEVHKFAIRVWRRRQLESAAAERRLPV